VASPGLAASLGLVASPGLAASLGLVTGPSLAASPYLWVTMAALGAGLAAGQVLGWAFGRVRRVTRRVAATTSGARHVARAHPRDRRSPGAGRLARAGAFSSFGILALAGLLVFPSKDYLDAPALCAWALFFALAGLAAGLWPRAGGAAAAALLVAVFALVHVAIASWTPFEGEVEIARLFPLELSNAQGGSVYRAELRIVGYGAGGGAVVSPRMIELPRDQTAIVAESIELRGPLAFLALFPKSPMIVLRLYRVVAIAGESEAPYRLPQSASPTDRLVSRFAALEASQGYRPGAPPAVKESLAGLFVRIRAASAEADVQPLQGIVFTLGDDFVPRIESSPGGSPAISPR
jgi:hypothetical protein